MVTNKQTTNDNRVNLVQVRSWTVNRADFCNKKSRLPVLRIKFPSYRSQGEVTMELQEIGQVMLGEDLSLFTD